ncbi:MAG: MerR family transcriptional regulator [Candidatus Aminicenantes bacterium]|nr:MerR family transcriptional regulator [Candidatus Aminicenantes bacterium]
MGKEIMTKNELAEKTGVEAVELELWTKAKILKPVGFTDDKAPFYSVLDVERAVHIRKLRELGYGLDEIQKIVKKYGWPGSGTGEKKAGEKDKLLTVGLLAEKAGVSPRTIKHWEDVGILDPDLRSEGGFRLYDEAYIFLCKLIRDLQLFGYSLEEIKAVSDSVRDFLSLQKDLTVFSREEAGLRLNGLLAAVETLNKRTRELQEGIDRWEDLLKKHKKEIVGLKARNAKRPAGEENAHA